jgi:UPF0755 protein
MTDPTSDSPYDPEEHLRVLRQHSHRRTRSNRRWRRMLVIAGFVVLIGLVVGAVALWVGRDRGTDAPRLSGPATQVQIPEGLAADDVARLLESKGIITSAADSVKEMQSRGATLSLKPGTYTFTPGQSMESILVKLLAGPDVAAKKITFPEGLSIDQAAARLNASRLLDGNEYARLAGEPSQFTVPLVGGTTPEVKTLEGLLFPETYFVGKDELPADLISRQLEEFQRKTAELPWGNTKALGITPYQAVIVASLIEKEVSAPDERAKVAAVIYNRLRKKMTLGFDSSVRYILKKWSGALTKSDLAVDSPYNTRKVSGLPPSPIDSPGLATLRAALEPAKVDYLYFVLQAKSGRLYFTNNYQDFLKAAKNAPPE